MSRTNGHAVRPRLQIPVTNAQRSMIVDAAKRSASEPNAWALAQVMKVAAVGKAAPAGTPLVLSGEVSDRVRQLAAAQDITPDELVAQLLLGAT